MTGMTDSIDVVSMFLLGLVGTGHCLGMCGPLVVAIPGRIGKFWAHLLYNLGRIATYWLIGTVLGSIGKGLTTLQSISQTQVIVAILVAVILFAFGLIRLGLLLEPGWMSFEPVTKSDKVKGFFNRLLTKKQKINIFMAGFFLGFLPCGLSYGAFSMSLAASGPLKGGLLTLAFGLGTFPGLLVAGATASAFLRKHRKILDIISGILMIGMGIWIGVKAINKLA